MQRLFLFPVLFCVMIFGLNAQPVQLIIKKGSKGLYLDHKVVPKEGLYSIGRLYNVNPKFIAAYNEIDLNKGLYIDQLIHIPLTDTNFTQKTNKGTPVYYTVGANENLLKVSNANNKVILKDLRNWNKLTSDNPPAGSKIIVGFLVAQEMATLANKVPVKQEEKPIVKTVSESEKTIVITKPAEEKIISKTEPVKEEPQVKEEPKKTEPSKTEPVFAKQEPLPLSAEQGYFKTSFEQQVKANPVSKNATVTAGVFKTTSGWQDAKYYLLIDGVLTGTIVKVINPDNNKAVYAKALGEMNGIRQNEGLNIRISNAAASALGVTDTEKFILKVNY